MGKRSIVRKRGGSPRYRSLGFRYKGNSSYLPYQDIEREDVYSAKIVNLINDPGRTAPLMIVEYQGNKFNLPAPLGVSVGDQIQFGVNAPIKTGNVLPLARIPAGTIVSNVELSPNDGGKLIRSAGNYSRVVLHEGEQVTIQLPSKKFKKISSLCRATIGVISGGGMKEKPFITAGNKSKAMKARGKLYPITSPGAMNAVDHKYGGKRAKKPNSVSRNAPPGRKVGSIASKRTGRKKR